jgi:hypothetical protein
MLTWFDIGLYSTILSSGTTAVAYFLYPKMNNINTSSTEFKILYPFAAMGSIFISWWFPFDESIYNTDWKKASQNITNWSRAHPNQTPPYGPPLVLQKDWETGSNIGYIAAPHWNQPDKYNSTINFQTGDIITNIYPDTSGTRLQDKTFFDNVIQKRNKTYRPERPTAVTDDPNVKTIHGVTPIYIDDYITGRILPNTNHGSNQNYKIKKTEFTAYNTNLLRGADKIEEAGAFIINATSDHSKSLTPKGYFVSTERTKLRENGMAVNPTVFMPPYGLNNPAELTNGQPELVTPEATKDTPANPEWTGVLHPQLSRTDRAKSALGQIMGHLHFPAVLPNLYFSSKELPPQAPWKEQQSVRYNEPIRFGKAANSRSEQKSYIGNYLQTNYTWIPWEDPRKQVNEALSSQ